jgi:hypothetical protein
MTSTPPPTLVDFLLEQITEDESQAMVQVARHHIEIQARTALTKTLVADPEHEYCTITAARVLVECQAKRRIVDRARLVLDSWHHLHGGDPTFAALRDVTERERQFAAETVYDLVNVYGSYEDYQLE